MTERRPAPIPPIPIGLATVAIIAWAALCVLAVFAAATAHGAEAPSATPADPIADAVAQGAAQHGIPAWAVSLLVLVVLPLVREWWRERQAARAAIRAIEEEGDSDTARRLKRTAAAEAARHGRGATKALARAVARETAGQPSASGAAQPGPARPAGGGL